MKNKSTISAAECESISTNGWDTVYAIRFPDVNKAIETAKSSPPSFLESQIWEDGPIKATGQFKPWKLTTGGEGKNVRMILPMYSGTLEFLKETDTLSKEYSATIEINLNWVDDGKLQNLSSSTIDAYVVSMDFGKNTITEIRQGEYLKLLEKWLKDNIQKEFKHTFSAVDVFDSSDEGSFSWIKPKGNLSYAVEGNDKDDDIKNSIFAVLCMTSDDDSPETHSVSSKAIPDDVNSAMLIKPKVVLTNMFLPNIHLLFDGASSEDFEISNGGMSITNNKEVTLEKQDMDGTEVKPKVNKGDFTLTIQDCKIAIKINMEFDYGILGSLGMMAVTVNHQSESTLGIDKDTGKFSMHVGHAKTDASIETSTGLLVVSIVASILGAIVGAAVGGLIGAAISAAGTEVTVEGGTQALLQGTEMTAIPAVRAGGAAATNIVPQTAAQAGTQVAAQITGVSGETAGLFATIWARMNAKVFGVLAGIIVGAAVPEIPNIIAHIGSNKSKDSVTLKVFGEKALNPVKWSNSSNDGYSIQALDLVDSLRLNIQREFDDV